MFYDCIGPTTDWVTGKICVNCPHCNSKTTDPKHTIVKHTIRKMDVGFLCLFPTYSYKIVEKDGFNWVCPTCKAAFTTGTLDISTRFVNYLS